MAEKSTTMGSLATRRVLKSFKFCSSARQPFPMLLDILPIERIEISWQSSWHTSEERGRGRGQQS